MPQRPPTTGREPPSLATASQRRAYDRRGEDDDNRRRSMRRLADLAIWTGVENVAEEPTRRGKRVLTGLHTECLPHDGEGRPRRRRQIAPVEPNDVRYTGRPGLLGDRLQQARLTDSARTGEPQHRERRRGGVKRCPNKLALAMTTDKALTPARCQDLAKRAICKRAGHGSLGRRRGRTGTLLPMSRGSSPRIATERGRGSTPAPHGNWHLACLAWLRARRARRAGSAPRSAPR